MNETATEPEVLDAELVPDPLEDPPAQPSTAVARRERRSEVIRPLDAGQLIESFEEYQALLPRLLSPSDYQAAGKDKDGKPKRFVKKSGWRKIATAFDLDVQIIRSTVERDEHGQPCRAEVWARAIAPSGRSMDGDGYCSVDEDRFSGPRGNKSKLENDLRGTATTRAMNRAISGLVGMGEVSAEEVTSVNEGNQGPAWAEEASPDRKRLALDSLTFLLGNTDVDRETARKGLASVKDALGVVPEGIAVALSRIARVVQEAHVDPSQPTQEELEETP